MLRMSDDVQRQHIGHRNKKFAYHIEWELRREAAVWDGDELVRPNLYPFGIELRKWMLRRSCSLPLFEASDNTYTNPYTRDASVLVAAYQRITNDLLDKLPPPPHDVDLQLRYVRLYTEFVLYTARMCEAMFKQMLYCTDFPEGTYRGAALGSLVTQDCRGCRASKSEPHRFSLAGSLAHHYRLCLGYEKCLEHLLPMVNRLRDTEAAHTGTAGLDTGSTDRLSNLRASSVQLGEDLLHMLEHIGEMEMKMWEDLASRIPAMVSG
jgi:hypothetical protein